MWGTDWTRAVGMLTYEQGVNAFRVTDRLSDRDRAALMGETLGEFTTGLPSDRPHISCKEWNLLVEAFYRNAARLDTDRLRLHLYGCGRAHIPKMSP